MQIFLHKKAMLVQTQLTGRQPRWMVGQLRIQTPVEVPLEDPLSPAVVPVMASAADNQTRTSRQS